MIQTIRSDDNPTTRDFAPRRPDQPKSILLPNLGICDTNSGEIGRKLVAGEAIGVATFAVPTHGSWARHRHIYALVSARSAVKVVDETELPGKVSTDASFAIDHIIGRRKRRE
jgi:hypothetical protein